MPTKPEPLAESVLASPTKRFFVEMLTRDIDLEDAILDLLDNCLDGVLRTTQPAEDDVTPYRQHWARLTLTQDGFEITDNCGGIEPELAERYAFRMGRPKDEPEEDLPTVGVYGIGMKRAIFKLGRAATIRSHASTTSFEVVIKPTWLQNDEDWNLPLKAIARQTPRGTTIEVTKLYPSVARNFAQPDFIDGFAARVASHYSFIIHKGFQVFINDTKVKPVPVQFLFKLEKGSRRGVAPFIYEGHYKDVEIRMVVGFHRPTPTQEEIDEDKHVKHSSADAGWTVICNDRVVLYCEKTRLTGWGEAGVPSFHNQFIAIAGIVEFRSNKAISLPVTTTKRGIDASSDIYLFAKNYMREGLKTFTNYTNKWKERSIEERENTKGAVPVSLEGVRAKVPEDKWTSITKNKLKERKFVPELPTPPVVTSDKLVRFSKPGRQIEQVSAFLFSGNREKQASEVGSKAFDWVLLKSKS